MGNELAPGLWSPHHTKKTCIQMKDKDKAMHLPRSFEAMPFRDHAERSSTMPGTALHMPHPPNVCMLEGEGTAWYSVFRTSEWCFLEAPEGALPHPCHWPNQRNVTAKMRKQTLGLARPTRPTCAPPSLVRHNSNGTSMRAVPQCRSRLGG
jgi:hypothetical protein